MLLAPSRLFFFTGGSQQTKPRRVAPSSPSSYTPSMLNKFGNLTVEPSTPDPDLFKDEFRPLSPPNSVRSNTSTVASPGKTTTTIPPLILPSSASTTTDISPAGVLTLITELGREYCIRRNTASVQVNLPIPTQPSIRFVPLQVQEHITKTTRRREQRKKRTIYKKTENKAFDCEACNIHCPNKATKEAHLKYRKQLRKTQFKSKR